MEDEDDPEPSSATVAERLLLSLLLANSTTKTLTGTASYDPVDFVAGPIDNYLNVQASDNYRHQTLHAQNNVSNFVQYLLQPRQQPQYQHVQSDLIHRDHTSYHHYNNQVQKQFNLASGGRDGLLSLMKRSIIPTTINLMSDHDNMVDANSYYHRNDNNNSMSTNQSTGELLLSAIFLQNKQQPKNGLEISWPNFILASILIVLMLTTAIGNLFVIVAILIERNLRTIGNYLVLSLAIADLLVACLVMPLASIYQILDSWTLGVLLCDIWTSADVFSCTASILHLLAIALDRYWAVTRVDYIRCQRNQRRILFMILFVWLAASIISLAPVLGWKDAQFESRITNNKECLISQDVGYQVFATCTTFWFPLTLTLIFYWKIYQVARKRIRSKLDRRGVSRKKATETCTVVSTQAATSFVASTRLVKQHSQPLPRRHPNPSSSTSSSSAITAGSYSSPVVHANNNHALIDHHHHHHHHHHHQQQQANYYTGDDGSRPCNSLVKFWPKSTLGAKIVDLVTGRRGGRSATYSASVLAPAGQGIGCRCACHSASEHQPNQNARQLCRITDSMLQVEENMEQSIRDEVVCVQSNGWQAIEEEEEEQQQQQQQLETNNNINGTRTPPYANKILVSQQQERGTIIGEQLNCSNCARCRRSQWRASGAGLADQERQRQPEPDKAGRGGEIREGEQLCGGKYSGQLEQIDRQLSATTTLSNNNNNKTCASPPITQQQQQKLAALSQTKQSSLIMNPSSCLANGIDSATNSISLARDIEFGIRDDGYDESEENSRRLGETEAEEYSNDEEGEEEEEDDEDEDGHSCASSTVSVCVSNSAISGRGTFGAELDHRPLGSQIHFESNNMTNNHHSNDDRRKQQQPLGDEKQSASNIVAAAKCESLANVRGSNSRLCDGDCCPTCCCDNSQISYQSDQQIYAASNKAGDRQRESSSINRSDSQQDLIMVTTQSGGQDDEEDNEDSAQGSGTRAAAAAKEILEEFSTVPAGRQKQNVMIQLLDDSRLKTTLTEPQHHLDDKSRSSSQTSGILWLLEVAWRRLKSAKMDRFTKNPSAALNARSDERAQTNPCPICHCPLIMEFDEARLLPERATRNSLGSTSCIVEADLESSRGPGLAVAAVTNAANLAVSTSALNNAPANSNQQQTANTLDKVQLSPTSKSAALSLQQATIEGVESKRERKAAKTLAIITGVFVMCWLPFFTMVSTMAVLQLPPHKYLFPFLLWLGYVNSMLNPIIYTIFSPDFRKAFKRLLCASDQQTPGSGQHLIGNNQRRNRHQDRSKMWDGGGGPDSGSPWRSYYGRICDLFQLKAGLNGQSTISPRRVVRGTNHKQIDNLNGKLTDPAPVADTGNESTLVTVKPLYSRRVRNDF